MGEGGPQEVTRSVTSAVDEASKNINRYHLIIIRKLRHLIRRLRRHLPPLGKAWLGRPLGLSNEVLFLDFVKGRRGAVPYGYIFPLGLSNEILLGISFQHLVANTTRKR